MSDPDTQADRQGTEIIPETGAAVSEIRALLGFTDRPEPTAEEAAAIAQSNEWLSDWSANFDAKLNDLTARQDAFLRYLELRQAD